MTELDAATTQNYVIQLRLTSSLNSITMTMSSHKVCDSYFEFIVSFHSQSKIQNVGSAKILDLG